MKVLRIYAFSTENWKRPKTEVEFILKLPKEFLDIYLLELISNNVLIKIIGDMEFPPDYTRDTVQYAIDRTRHNDGPQLNFALNYGSRHEIRNAVKEIVADIKDTKLSLDEVGEQQFSRYFYTTDMPNPDLLIRTSGEKRISIFSMAVGLLGVLVY